MKNRTHRRRGGQDWELPEHLRSSGNGGGGRGWRRAESGSHPKRPSGKEERIQSAAGRGAQRASERASERRRLPAGDAPAGELPKTLIIPGDSDEP